MTRIKNTYLAALAVLLSPMAANAELITITGTDTADGIWDVTVTETSYDVDSALLESQVWWGDSPLAAIFTEAIKLSLGTYGLAGPSFAYVINGTFTNYFFWSDKLTVGGAGTGDTTFYAVANRVSVPEPGTLALLGLGLAGIGFARRKKV